MGTYVLRPVMKPALFRCCGSDAGRRRLPSTEKLGESLYGDPGLCIRELLQNALDALELRELRLKMKQEGEAPPVIGHWVFRHSDFRAQPARGTDEETGQQWLRVTDNGVGMTEEVIKNYFTQIGKSFIGAWSSTRNEPP